MGEEGGREDERWEKRQGGRDERLRGREGT